MKAETFAGKIRQLGIETVVGVPDSALKPFCDYMNEKGQKQFTHYVPANEGAAVGIGIGNYLATGKPVCIYAQNSGIGNMVNPITSLANEAVYGIPMLLVIGWRGEPGTKDEPQHKFMGSMTESMLHTLQIEYAILAKELSLDEVEQAFNRARDVLRAERQFAFLVKRDFFEPGKEYIYQNNHLLVREQAIHEIISAVGERDVVVSTTGKISREVYEQSNQIKGNHKQDFLTVGGMGHASMIAFGIAQARPDRRVYCLDGDGAILMHMGGLAFLGKQKPGNLVHICLNNEAHESVGGMPTGCVGMEYAKVAVSCGYPVTYVVEDALALRKVLEAIEAIHKLTFIEIRVALSSRTDLGRPAESAQENKVHFMNCHGGN